MRSERKWLVRAEFIGKVRSKHRFVQAASIIERVSCNNPTDFPTFRLEKGRIFNTKSESVGGREQNLFVTQA